MSKPLFGCPGRRVAALVICLVLVLAVAGEAQAAFVWPINYGGNTKTAAVFGETHGGWHYGLDFPATTNPPTDTQIMCIESATTVDTLWSGGAMADLQVVVNEDSTVIDATTIEVRRLGNKYMLDIIRVRNVTKDATYTVTAVEEGPAGSGMGTGKFTIAAVPPGQEPVVSDTLDVDYAYYTAQITQMVATVGTEYHWYAHIYDVHKEFAWNAYPATSANRFYAGNVPAAPAGRSATVLAKGQAFARVQDLNYGTEEDHVDITVTTGLTLNTAVNTLATGRWPSNDPGDRRPVVSNLRFRKTAGAEFAATVIFDKVDIYSEAKDDMGASEAARDDAHAYGDPNGIREAGIYNVGYWIECLGGGGSGIRTEATALKLLASAGFDAVPAVATGVVYNPAYEIDINTNYHYAVSHHGLDVNQHWNTRAKDGAGVADNGVGAANSPLNEQAKFKDGAYKTYSKAWDVVGEGAAFDKRAIVDNFRPYVKRVQVGNSIKYQASWNWADPNVNFNKTVDEPLTPGSYKVEIEFSEPMTDTPKLNIEGFGDIVLSSAQPTDQRTTWTGALSVPADTAPLDGNHLMTIDANDLANETLLKLTMSDTAFDPLTNVNRDIAGVMLGTAGSDTRHAVKVETGGYTSFESSSTAGTKIGGYIRVLTVGVYTSNPHGSYSATTNKCKVCHSVHRATGIYKLLAAATDAHDACDYCHVGSGAHTNKLVYGYASDNPETPPTLAGNGHTIGASLASIPDTGTVSAGGDLLCNTCHTVHGAGAILFSSAATNILRAAPVGGAGVANSGSDYASSPGTVKSFCLQCHDANDGTSSHRYANADSSSSWANANYCFDCHNASGTPHAATEGGHKLLTSRDDTSSATAGTLDDVCRRCHISGDSTGGVGITF